MSAVAVPAAASPRRAPARRASVARTLAYTRRLGDALAVTAACLVAYRLAGGSTAYATLAALGYTLVLGAVLEQRGLYAPPPSPLDYVELAGTLRTTVAVGLVGGAFLFLIRPLGHAAPRVLGAVTLAALFVPLGRRLVLAVSRALARRGWLEGRRVLLCGAGPAGRLALQQLVRGSSDGTCVVGFVDDILPLGEQVRCRVAQTGVPAVRVPVLGRVRDWERLCEAHAVEELLIAMPWVEGERARVLLRAAGERGLRATCVPDLGGSRADMLEADSLAGVPLLRVADLSTAREPALKRAFDVVAAALLLVLTSPLWAAAALAVRLGSPGPVFFVHERVGCGGRAFRMYKFRTMRADADPYAPSPAGDAHPGITRAGRVLRVSGFDELPQLLNVLSGEMSLVGPRPEMPFIVAGYTPHECQRLHARPGLTGLWQLSPDRHVPIHRHVEHDLYYVRHQSLLLDLLVLLETVVFTAGVVARRLGGAVRRRLQAGPDAGVLVEGDEWFADLPAGHYVFAAFDQRSGALERLELQLATTLGARHGHPVKLLVAPANLVDVDAVLARVAGAPHPVEYVMYNGREPLRPLVERAALVVTDLPHVAAWAREADVELVALPDAPVRHLPVDDLPPDRVAASAPPVPLSLGARPAYAARPDTLFSASSSPLP